MTLHRRQHTGRAGAFLLVLLLLAGVAAAIASPHIATWRYSRDLDCARQVDTRTRQLCASVERHLEYTCCGHAILSPGYRTTSRTVASAWCDQRIGATDRPALLELSRSGNLRLSIAAQSLFRLLTGHDLHGTPEAEVSILNPAHPSYVLKDGCGARGP